MKGLKVIIASFLAILYTALIAISYSLKIDFLLFILASPWSSFMAIVSGFFMHESINFDNWLLAGTFLNLMFFLWLFLFKPLFGRSVEASD